MKIFGIVIAFVLGALALVVALVRVGMPALLLAAALAAVAWWLTSTWRKDRYVGWGNFRALGVMALLATGVWLVISVLSGALLVSLPLMVLVVASAWWIRHCNAQLRVSAKGSSDSSLAQQNDEAANAFVNDTILENRRSHARGRGLHLQAENLELLRKNRALEEEVARLRAEVNRLDSVLNDPFYDPT